MQIRKNAIRKIRKILEGASKFYTFSLSNNFAGEECEMTPEIIEQWFSEITSGIAKLIEYEGVSSHKIRFHSNLWFEIS